MIDPTSDIGKVRLLISDVDEANHTFGDDEIQAFLDIEGADVLCAAALGLETLAANEVLLFKKIKVLKVMEIDAPAVAEQLLAQAQQLRERADDDGTFAIADGSCWV